MNVAQPPPAGRIRWMPGQSLARVGRLARKELSEILRDRRTIITLVLMPLLLYPLLSFAFRQFLPAMIPTKEPDRPLTIGVAKAPRRLAGEKTQKDRVEELFALARRTELSEATAVVGLLVPSGGTGPLLARDTVWTAFVSKELAHEPAIYLPARHRPGALAAKPYPPVVIQEVEDLDRAMADGEIDVALLVFPFFEHMAGGSSFGGDWVVSYPEYLARSRQLADYVEQHITLANARQQHDQLRRLKVQQQVMSARVVRKVDEPIPLDTSQLSLTAVIPLILILMTITGAVYPAIDLTAGERERGTLEILVSAPVPRMALLLAKYVAVVTVAMLTATINLAMMLITLDLNQLTSLVFKGPVTLGLVVQLFFLLMLFAAFFSAVLLALTSFARSFKEAQAYLIPLMLASLAPGLLAMMPGLNLAGPLVVTPLVNIVLLARDLSEGHASLGVTVVVVISTLVYAVVAISIAARVFGAEAVLYSEQSSWSDLVRRPTQAQPTAAVAGALFCLALMFPAFFVLVSLLAYVPEDLRFHYQVLGSAVLFVGFPLLACWLRRIRLVSSLQLRRPPEVAWAAAYLLAAACVPVIYFVVYWMRQLGWTLLTAEQEVAIRAMVQSWRRQEPAPFIATFALIGITEEVLFRGYLFSALRAVANQRVTIIVSAVLFGLFHAVSQFDRLVPSTLMGLLLGWLAWQTRSILPGMLLHGTFNGLIIWLAYHQSTILPGQPARLDYEVPLWWQIAALPVGLAAAGLVYWFRAREPVLRPVEPDLEDILVDEGPAIDNGPLRRNIAGDSAQGPYNEEITR